MAWPAWEQPQAPRTSSLAAKVEKMGMCFLYSDAGVGNKRK